MIESGKEKKEELVLPPMGKAGADSMTKEVVARVTGVSVLGSISTAVNEHDNKAAVGEEAGKKGGKVGWLKKEAWRGQKKATEKVRSSGCGISISCKFLTGSWL